MEEMDTYHTQKVEDFQALAKDHLDGEIALYEQVRHPTPFTVHFPLNNDSLLNADPDPAT